MTFICIMNVKNRVLAMEKHSIQSEVNIETSSAPAKRQLMLSDSLSVDYGCIVRNWFQSSVKHYQNS